GQLAVGPPDGERRVLLHRQMGVALEVEDVLTHEVGAGEGRLDVAELERDGLVDVGAVAVLVDPDLGAPEGVLDRHERRQHLVLTSISSVARSAVSSSTAATAATASPTIRTFSVQSASSSWETGRVPNLTRGSSRPVRTP